MRIKTGSPVSGDDFYKRPHLIDKAWDLIESGAPTGGKNFINVLPQ